METSLDGSDDANELKKQPSTYEGFEDSMIKNAAKGAIVRCVLKILSKKT